MINVIEKIKKVDNKLTIIMGLFVSGSIVYDKVIDNPLAKLLQNQKVQSEALAAEYDLDKVVFKRYHLELYHSNKNDKGQIKFSYIKHDGWEYKAWVDPTSGFWVYKKGHDVNYIKELSH